jgi:hypothetical protein
MGQIPFTQYLLPNGRRKSVSIEMDDAVSAFADALIAKGYRFEIELLSNLDTVSMTVVDPSDSGDIAMVLCENGPAIPSAVAKLVRQATEYDETEVISGD